MDYQNSSSSSSNKEKSFFDAFPSKTAFIMGFVAAILVAGTIGFVVLGSNMLDEDKEGSKAVAADDAPTAPTAPTPPPPAPTGDPAPVGETDNVNGPDSAKLTLIEYSDFECPFCSRFHDTVKQVEAEYGDDVRVVFRHFPLSFHANAESAALATECAGDQGKFFEFADKIFSDQSILGAATYDKYAGELGLDAGKFKTCMDDEKFLDKIRAQSQEGVKAGVTGTPGSFLVDADGNVQMIKGAQPFSSVKATIDGMLN